ncbi:MAG: DNA-primase RepB domain-containing protein, partial [Synergistaceae bacterium]
MTYCESFFHTLGAPFYRVQGEDPVKCERRVNFCKGYNQVEQLWTPEYIAAQTGFLQSRNCDGYNIYCLPAQPNVGFLLIDDCNSQEKEAARQALPLGLPRIVLESSAGNKQYIYAVRIPGLSLSVPITVSPARRAGNYVMRAVNTLCGDPNISGIFHLFRIPGFRNKKPSRNNFCVRLVEAHPESYSEFLESMVQDVQDGRPVPLLQPGKFSPVSAQAEDCEGELVLRGEIQATAKRAEQRKGERNQRNFHAAQSCMSSERTYAQCPPVVFRSD